MWLSVTTAHQHASSATRMIGNTVRPIVPIIEASVECESLNSKRAHCTAKHNSAIVAIDRPRKAEENGESHTHIRSKSILGRIERNAQPPTKRPDNMSCLN